MNIFIVLEELGVQVVQVRRRSCLVTLVMQNGRTRLKRVNTITERDVFRGVAFRAVTYVY